MRTCNDCGKRNPEEASFCLACGRPVDELRPERRKLATMLFCDLSGSTALGERLDAESVRELMFRYFHEMRSAIERHGGTVEKFVGDAVMAVFGVPVAHEDDALRAARASIEMRAGLQTLNVELERRFGARLSLRIGLNSGEVVAGHGSGGQTLVSGDAVNIAARLEQAAGQDEILLGQLTYQLARLGVQAEELKPIVAKGKKEPVTVYRLLSVNLSDAAPDHAESFFMGRASELASLELLFERAVLGKRCVLATIVGEPGVGKSRLCAELIGRLAERARVCSGRCLSYGDGITLWTLAEMIRQASGIHDEHSPYEARDRIRSLVGPAVGDPIATLIGIDGDVAAPEARWATRKLFETLAGAGPLVALVEDIHWAEPTLLDLLEHAAERTQAPVLLLCTARPELAEKRPDWPITLGLEPLEEQDVRQLLEPYALPEGDRAKVVSSARGNPLFAEELASYLRDGPGASKIPATLGALLTARLDLLPEAQRVPAERGSVEGEIFHRGAVAALSGRNVDAELDGLVRRELLRPAQASFVGEAAFRFKHILVRDAAYAGLAKKARAELHERFADWLEAKAGERLPEYEEIVGYHLEQAHRYRQELGALDERLEPLGLRASERLSSAGLRARRRGDETAAVRLLERALPLLPKQPRAAELFIELGLARDKLGESTAAEAALTEATEIASSGGDLGVELHARLVHVLLRAEYTGEAWSEVGRLAEETIPVFEELGYEYGLARALNFQGIAHANSMHYGAAITAYERALECDKRAVQGRFVTTALSNLGMALAVGPTPVEDALKRCSILLDQSAGHALLEAGLLAALGYLEAARGCFEESRSLFRRGAILRDEYGLRDQTDFAGRASMLAGDPRRAELELRCQYELFPPGHSDASSCAAILAEAICAQGRDSEAEELASVAQQAAHPDNLEAQIGWRLVRAKLLARKGEVDGAERLAREAVELAFGTDALNLRGDCFHRLAEVLNLAGRGAAISTAVEQAIRLYEKKGNVVSAEQARSLLADRATFSS
jgi:class 3 adenylate cyclase/tetratricopeptide (TPR) repeat protein